MPEGCGPLFCRVHSVRRTPEKSNRKPERNVKKLKRWILLSAAGALAVLIGSRLEEAVALDYDSMGRP